MPTNPTFSGPARICGDWGSGDLLASSRPSYIDRNAFVSPAPYTYGNTPRTLPFDLHNPHTFNQDLSVRRTVGLAGRSRVILGAEVFNVFNTVRFGSIGTNITGRISAAS